MDRITNIWSNLSRREQILAGCGVGAILLLAVMLLMMGGGDGSGTLDASSTGDATQPTEMPVQPQPGMIVGSPGVKPPDNPVVGATGGVAALSSAGASKGPIGLGPDIEGARMEASANAQLPTVNSTKGGYVNPVVSASIAAAGRDLEAVGKAYAACTKVNRDIRRCVQVLKYGVHIESTLHHDGYGVTLTKASVDGHQLDYTIMPGGGTACRALDKKPSCNAWGVR